MWDWDALYAHLLTCFPGWTWEYIDDHIDIPRIRALTSYWRLHPPLHIVVPAALGIKPQSGGSQSIEDAAEFVPVAHMSENEFNETLRRHGMPVPTEPTP